MAKKCRGRQKVEMVKMKNEYNLQVTFSKRRSGLFKKASELSTLCGTEIAVIVFSPGNKVFSFGYPNVNDVVDRVFNFIPPCFHQHNNVQHNETQQIASIQNLNNQLTEVTNQLEEQKKRNKELKQKRKGSQMSENWWEQPLEELDLTQLMELRCGLENLKKAVATEASKHLQPSVFRSNFYVGSSSTAVFGTSGDHTNINIELDVLTHRRMVSINTSNYNHNMNGPTNHASPFGNNGNNAQRFTPRHNMNFKREDNQN